MPLKKSTERNISNNEISLKRGISILKINYTEKLQKVNIYLATIFLLIWIFVGLFASLVVLQSVKQGFLNGIFSKAQAPVSQTQPQTEADLPGVGKVNIACTEQALSQDAIQRVMTRGDTSVLTADEKAKLEPCIVAPASTTPSATPSAQ
ncbi:MAG: hypothetical protein Q7S45_03465 [Candidatus Curtissbacteria bacterium]|nr:hypothetical protein [Candidatus Curtissbacteria bacterium]